MSKKTKVKPKNRMVLPGIILVVLMAAGGYFFGERTYGPVASNNQTYLTAPKTNSPTLNAPSDLSSAPSEFYQSSSAQEKEAIAPIVTSFKKVTKLTLDEDRTVLLLGEVGENAIVAASKITELSSRSQKPIYLLLSGPGGSVLTGAILISAIQASSAPVYTICDVICASMDAMIHQYGTKRYLTDRTVMMFHPASAGTQGDVDRMYSMSKFLVRYTNKMELEVAKKQKISFEEYKLKTQVNLWIDAEDSVAENVADGIVNYRLKASFNFMGGAQDRNKQNKQRNTNNPIDVQWICNECLTGATKWLTLK